MRSDLLERIKEQQDITNAVVLTHNLDFVYLQNLLLPALRRCGSPSLTVFADAHCAAEAFSRQAPLLSNLGRRYRVVPVAMQPGFRFHPKALLLSGRKKAILAVGSGNLGFAGWRENAEVWVSYDSDEGTAEIAAFQVYLRRLVERLALNDSLWGEIEEAFDSNTRSWVADLEAPAGLLGRLGAGPPLIADLLGEIGPGPVDRLLISAPYFDRACAALRSWTGALDPAETVVATDPEQTNLRPGAPDQPPAGVTFRPARASRATASGGERRCFVHAKIYAAQQGDEVTLFAGSANCSRAALTLEGERGNAELMAVRRLSVEQLEREILEEVVIGEEPLELPAESPLEPDPEPHAVGPRLLAARDQDGLLRMAYIGPADWRPEHAVIDGSVQVLRHTGPERCECLSLPDTHSVSLRGTSAGQVIETSPLWIDHEESLAASAYRRSLQSVVRSKGWKSDWDVGDWGEILEVFCQDLEYVSPRRAMATNREEKDRNSEDKIFTREDLFTRDVGLHLSGSPADLGGRKISVPSLLLQWFGYGIDEESPEGSDPAEEPVSLDLDEEPVDRPEKLFETKKQTPEEKAKQRKREERQGKKARMIVDRMAATMSASRYLEMRQPEHLAKDWKIAFLLLRMGLSKGWIDREHLLVVTFQIWGKLFLADTEKTAQGWLDKGASSSELRETIASPELTAALFAWSLEIPDRPTTARGTQLLLTLALAVSRHPWLWISSDLTAVAAALASLLEATGETFDEEAIETRWRQLMQLGRALNRFESAVKAVPVQELREQNRQAQVRSGEILYQGGALGFCVAQEFVDRSEDINIHVLTLHEENREVPKLNALYLNPLAGLLETEDVIPGHRIETADLEALRRFVENLEAGLATESLQS